MFGLPTSLQQSDDTELKEIMKETIMFQNGTTASQMAKSGVHGNMNYGVSVTDIQRISAKYGKNHQLAQRLCRLNIREAKLLASRLFVASMLTDSDLQNIFDSIANIDLAENLARNIICEIDDIKFIEQLANGNVWQTVSAILAIDWAIIKKMPHSNRLATWFIEHLQNLAEKELPETRRPILIAMEDFAKLPNGYGPRIADCAKRMASSSSDFCKEIGERHLWMLNTDNNSI